MVALAFRWVRRMCGWAAGGPPAEAWWTARSRIWPTAMPVRRAWERRDAGRVRSRGDSTDVDEGKARRLRPGKRCGLVLGGFVLGGLVRGGFVLGGLGRGSLVRRGRLRARRD